jgi:hypothetical protein
MSEIIKTSVPSLAIKQGLKVYAIHKIGSGSLSQLYEIAIMEYIKRHRIKYTPAVVQEWIDGKIEYVADNQLIDMIQELIDSGKIKLKKEA